MYQKSLLIFTRLFSLVFILAAVGLTVAGPGLIALGAAQAPGEAVLPPGTIIAGIPVGGLDESAARARIEAAYATPVELIYQQNRILADPHDLGFTLHSDAMLEQARQPEPRSWYTRFWRSLWHTPPAAGLHIPLISTIDAQQIRSYLEHEIVPRYDLPARRPYAISNTAYRPGQPGWALDVAASIPLIEARLSSLSDRSASLPVIQQPAPPISLEQVKAVLLYNIDQLGFDGLVTFAMTDLQSGAEMLFGLQNGVEVDPEIAFTAASTIKVPIKLSVMKRTAEPTPEEVYNLLIEMSARSENPPADQLMQRYINEIRGPLVVTEDLRALGLENTFLAGYFYLGAPLLDRFTTPANSRTDINLRPDIYNQSTAADMLALMTWIYDCAVHDRGRIRQTFADQVTQTECQLILDVMAQNKTGLLFEAGIPDVTRVAHKHGWVEEADGQLRNMSDIGVVYTPGGNYAFSLFIYHPERLDFDATNILVAQFSLAIYNAFNLDDQFPWMPFPRP